MTSDVTSSLQRHATIPPPNPGPAPLMPDRSTPLRLRLHGYPSVHVGERLVPLKLKHALALLAHLSQTRGPVGRAHLASLLWPEGEPALVRGRLRRLVHQTHEAVQAVLFDGDADSLWLRDGWHSDMQGTQSTMAQLAELAARAGAAGRAAPAAAPAAAPGSRPPGMKPAPRPQHLAQLVEPLLAPQAAGWLEGFSLGADAFDGWVDQVRRSHAAALTRALESAAAMALALQGGKADPADEEDRADTADKEPASHPSSHATSHPANEPTTERTIELADRIAEALLRLDPCHETGHGTRMAARAARGDAAGVETAYFECARILREELGVRPSAALEAAYARATAAVRPLAARPLATAGAAAPLAPAEPEIRLARTPLGHVAYADWGTAGHEAEPPTVVVQWGIMSNLEVALEEPRARSLLDQLARRYRIVMLDRRGSGLAERVGVSPDAAAGVEDIVATLDDLGVGRAWIFGSSVGGTLALEFALRQRQRTAGLLLYGTSPVGRWREDWPWALPACRLDDWVAGFTDPARYDESLRRMAPSVADDPTVRRWYARLLRNSSTPHGAAVLLRAYQAMDLRPRLAQVDVPTLVLQRRGDRIVPLAAGERLAQAIPGARFQLLEGDDHFLWHGETATLLQSLQRFVDRHSEAATTQRLAA